MHGFIWHMNEALCIAWRAEFAIYRFGATLKLELQWATMVTLCPIFLPQLYIDRPGAGAETTPHEKKLYSNALSNIHAIYDVLIVYKCIQMQLHSFLSVCLVFKVVTPLFQQALGFFK